MLSAMATNGTEIKDICKLTIYLQSANEIQTEMRRDNQSMRSVV